jgi:nucleolar protein 56
MSPRGRSVVVTTWYGTFLVADGQVIERRIPPLDPATLADRARRRRAGDLTPEELAVLEAAGAGATLASRDRRLAAHGVEWDRVDGAVPPATEVGTTRTAQREVLLRAATDALRAAWDPSLHVEEAVRGVGDLDRTLNLLAERLASWAGRDAIATETALADDPGRIARAIVDGTWGRSSDLPPIGPALTDGRRALARLYLETRAARDALESAVEAALPARAPNLSALLGPALAARLISQAGGLDRLARLPASTVQVLGAERAFFEHLRGHGSSPRHGLLFLHPRIQSARRPERGRLARALAGKAAIAARLDLAGAAIRPELAQRFEARAEAIRSTPRTGGARRPVRRRLRLPLDRAAEHR